MSPPDNPGRYIPAQPDPARSTTLRLLFIPFIVYIAWVLEIFLLEGSIRLFQQADPVRLLIYTIFGCIVTGMVIPVLMVQRSFVSRATNMNQIGFRSFPRTLVSCVIAAAVGYLLLVLFPPAGAESGMTPGLFLLFLPSGIASVMICWVLLGTHIQAYVRHGGVLVSITTGIVTTTLLFGMTPLAYAPSAGAPARCLVLIGIGVVAALSFFALRDVYAASILATAGLAVSLGGLADPQSLSSAMPSVWLSAGIAGVSLIGIHAYFRKNFTTVIVVDE